MSVLIKNTGVLSCEEVIKDTNLFIKDGVISYIGSSADFKADTVIDGRNKVVMPGLVNAHTHVAMTLFRSYADGLPLEEWLFNKIFPVEDRLTDEDIYWGSMLGILEMIASGATAFNEMYAGTEAIARAVEETGVRAVISRGLLYSGTENTKTEKRLLECMEFYKGYNGTAGGRIRAAFGMHSVYTCSPEYLRDCALSAAELNAPAHIHLSETGTEQENCIKTYGKTPAMVMDEAGVFDLPCVAAHCVHLTDEDMKILSSRGVYAAFNPSSNLKLKSGIAPVSKMMDAGVKMCLGTDGASSNNNLNMMEEMHIGALLSGVSARDMFFMATKAGANALGFENTGDVKEGMRADILIIDTDKPHFHPEHDIRANMVYSAQGGDVSTVLVDGKVLYHKGEYKTADYERIKFNVEKCRKRLFEV